MKKILESEKIAVYEMKSIPQWRKKQSMIFSPHFIIPFTLILAYDNIKNLVIYLPIWLGLFGIYLLLKKNGKLKEERKYPFYFPLILNGLFLTVVLFELDVFFIIFGSILLFMAVYSIKTKDPQLKKKSKFAIVFAIIIISYGISNVEMGFIPRGNLNVAQSVGLEFVKMDKDLYKDYQDEYEDYYFPFPDLDSNDKEHYIYKSLWFGGFSTIRSELYPNEELELIFELHKPTESIKSESEVFYDIDVTIILFPYDSDHFKTLDTEIEIDDATSIDGYNVFKQFIDNEIILEEDCIINQYTSAEGNSNDIFINETVEQGKYGIIIDVLIRDDTDYNKEKIYDEDDGIEKAFFKGSFSLNIDPHFLPDGDGDYPPSSAQGYFFMLKTYNLQSSLGSIFDSLVSYDYLMLLGILTTLYFCTIILGLVIKDPLVTWILRALLTTGLVLAAILEYLNQSSKNLMPNILITILGNNVSTVIWSMICLVRVALVTALILYVLSYVESFVSVTDQMDTVIAMAESYEEGDF